MKDLIKKLGGFGNFINVEEISKKIESKEELIIFQKLFLQNYKDIDLYYIIINLHELIHEKNIDEIHGIIDVYSVIAHKPIKEYINKILEDDEEIKYKYDDLKDYIKCYFKN